MRIISTVHVTFCGSWNLRLLQQYLKKILIGRKSWARGTMKYIIYGENIPLNRSFRGHYLHPRGAVLCTLLAISFFPSEKFLLTVLT